MSAHRRHDHAGGSDSFNSPDYIRGRQPGRRPSRRPAGLSRAWLSVIGAAAGIAVVAAGIHTVPKLVSTATAAISQVGTATTFQSRQAATAVTAVPAGTVAGNVLLTFVETRKGSTVTCASGARLILSQTRSSWYGIGTRLAGCLTVTGSSVPATVKVGISPRNEVAAVTMAFAGVSHANPVDVLATSSSSTSPSVTMSGKDLVVYGLGSSGLAAVAAAPAGSKLQATVNNSAHAQVAAATRAGQTGTAAAGNWGLAPSSVPLAATVALLTEPPAATATPTSPAAGGDGTTPPAGSPSGNPTSPGSDPASSAPASAPPSDPAGSAPSGSASAPTSPPVTWCESGLPASPYTSAPAGAVTVPAGNNGSFDFSTPNTTYWFAPGTHTLGTSTGGQINPAKGDTYIGAPGAVIDGQKVNQYAFIGDYQDLSDENVTIEYLTIQNFHPSQGGGAVNGNGNNGWTEKYNLMKGNSPGAAMMLGGDNTVSDNCLTANGEYGFNGYSYVDQTYGKTFTGGATNITMTGNDIAGNNTQKTDSGIEGGGKFWQNGNVVVTGNYVHDNIDSPGLWADTDNAGFLISGNYIAHNDGPGLMYEISYNASVTGNAFVGNAIKGGEGNAGFPTGAIYISESGGDASVPSNYAGQLNIASNVFQDNWSGVVIYQNSNRYSGDGQDPGTLTPPSGTSVGDWVNNADKTCPSHLSQTSPVNYNALCQWRSQNVTVQNNTFQFNPSDSIYGGQCTQAHSCGQNALFAVYSDTSAYPKWTVCNNISNNQNNHFTNNTYTGPWTFVYFNQGDTVGASAWQAGVSNVEGSGYSFKGQDQGSSA
jgi:parallel beta helix pectate lyase-like protein